MPKVRRHGVMNHIVEPKVTENEKLSNFKKNYEFKKPHSVRSPVSKWEHEYMMSNTHVCDQYCMHSKQEMALIKGTPHGYRHEHVGGRAGKLRLSNMKGAHRIGARKKK